MRETRSFAIGVLFALLPIGARAGDRSEERVVTHGISVAVTLTPACRLGGDDPDARGRADTFLAELRAAIGHAVGDVEFPLGFPGWAAEVALESEALPSGSRTGGVRIVKPSSALDQTLMHAMYRASMPKLPNFRARCTFAVAIRAWQPSPKK